MSWIRVKNDEGVINLDMASVIDVIELAVVEDDCTHGVRVVLSSNGAVREEDEFWLFFGNEKEANVFFDKVVSKLPLVRF